MEVLTQHLDHAYRELRQSWATQWAGLPRAVSGAVHWLCGPRRNQDTREHQQRLASLLKCAEVVEAAGKTQALEDQEPAYHNRLHIADTVVGMAALLRARRPCAQHPGVGQPMSRSEFYCLAAMVLHDFGHDGRTNEFPREIEQASIESFSTYVQSCGLSEPDWSLLQRLILETDPRFVGDVHARLSDAKPKHSSDELSFEEMAVLVVEADVLASALKFPGEDLTLGLIQEWAPRYPDRAKQLSFPTGRLGFLRFGARFTSISARMLGLPDLVAKQISALDPQM